MARGAPGLPRAETTTLSKRGLLAILSEVDRDAVARERVLKLETAFRAKIATHKHSLVAAASDFRKLKTSPFVLLVHASLKDYAHVHEIDRDILPAKRFSSMETSTGRMVEEVTLPAYGWTCVASKMHSSNSALDGRKAGSTSYSVATLKSGPRCLNDGMSQDLAGSIIEYVPAWAREAGVREIDFTYGVLYGTARQSNKKDWHILRNLRDEVPRLPRGKVSVSPDGRWDCSCSIGGIRVTATVRIGLAWWTHLGGPNCLIEVLVALIRACVIAAPDRTQRGTYVIGDLARIVDLNTVTPGYNVGLLQRDQLPWLFLMACHFCDVLAD